MRKRILSIWLSVCMVLTMLPISAMAKEADASIGASGEIIAFAPLDETEMSVPTGTAIEDLGLPEALTATVRIAVTADSSTAEEAVQDSGNLDNLTEATPGSATPTGSGEQTKADETTEPEWNITTSDIPVTWTSEPKYDMDAEGDYVFTPVIEDHTVSADLPEITVTVGAQPLMMALRTGTPDTYGDFSVSIDEAGEAPTFDESSKTLTFSAAGEYTVGMADGKTSTTNRIEVTSAANITLDGVNIDVSSTENAAAFKITDTAGAVNLILAGGSVNTLKSGKYCAGLQKDTTAEGTMLTIGGTGTLNATSGGFAAGIGGSNTKNGSYITISGGRITATGNGAGIGGGISASGNHIVISGGTVTTKGGYMAAGIGGGHGGDGRYITISGGTVTAEGGYLSVGIGAGTDGVSSNITISGGSVNAYCYSGEAIGATPTNGADTPVNVYKVVIPIAGDTTGGVDISSMTFTSGGNAYIYNMFGAKSILDSGVGKVYVYLPGSSEGIAATASYGGVTYSGGVTSSATTLTPPAPQAQWGVAGSGGAKPTAWTQGTLADAMSYANSLASGTAYIQLLSDVNLNAALDFVSGKTTILDLNGKKIDRGLTAAISDGNVVNINGNLTLKDSSTAIVANQGKITGGFSSGPASTYVYNGGCVDVNNHASFTMTGGNITGNKSTNSSPGGGGVYVDQYGSFIMTGGSIDNNQALYWGGGIYANGSLTMLGGSITGNKSKNGGVYFASNFTVGGTAVIDDNQTTDATPIERNVVLVSDTISVHSGTPLTTGAFIGVTANSAPTSGLPVNVTGTNSNDYSSYFFSDNSGYMIQNSASNVVQLAVATPVIGMLTISDSFTAGHDLTLSELNSKYKPSITANGVAITAEGWQRYNPNSGGYWEILSSDIPLDTESAFTLHYYATHAGGTVYSNAVTLNVVGKTTVLALTAAPESPQDTGTPITLTATLTGFFAGPGVSGQTITFKNGTTTLGTASLNSGGVASYIWTPSGADSYSLTAEYAATSYNAAATSNTLSYTVNVALPTAATYAAGAASGTDYVLDTDSKTLTIKTDKGAAWWSANGASYLDYTVLLAADIDVSDFLWTPVGSGSGSDAAFSGSFDGQGHSISGLTITAANESYAGLFGGASSAAIRNLCVSGTIEVTESNELYIGGISGCLNNNSTIRNCCSHVDIRGAANEVNAGGIAGWLESGTIENCFNTGDVSGTGTAAMIAGGIYGAISSYSGNSGIIKNSYNTGSVTGSGSSITWLGALGGNVGSNIVMENCYYLSGTASKAFGYGSDSNGSSFTAGEADDLLAALNGWVAATASTSYYTWAADSATPVNGGYPVLNAVWGSLNLTGVGCNVAFGKLTGTTDNMQYSLDGGSTWQDCAAGDTTDLTFVAGTVKVRQKDNQTNVRTVITIAAPATSNAPTLGSKTYNSVTLTAMTGYEYSKDGGATWQNSNLFASLSSSTTYSFVARIKATATALPGTISAVLNVTTNEAPSGDGGSNGGGTNTPVGTPVIVDGKTQNIGTEKKSGDSTTVTVDQSKLGTNIGGATAGSSVVVPVSENGVATASLVVKNIEDMAAKGMTLTIQTGSVAYNLNTAAIDTAALQAAFPGADMSAVPFNVTITNSSASVEGETLVLSPMSFTVTAAYGGKTVDVDAFSAYIDRVIEVTKEQAAKITTAVVVNADGSVRHVPTNVIEKDGKYYAIINSRTNSTYALIQNEVTFSDATGKWYEAAVNEMGSRKIIAGRSADLFDGGASITRAEFAAILIRALGLPADGASTFSDVPANAWYTGATATAVKYGLAEGKGDNRFDPSAAITRQEAMLMLQRAAALTEFTGTSGDLGSFADANSVGSWAQGAAKWSVGSSLIQGSGGKLNPTANITRAESATIILRLLQKAELVDVRSKA